MLYTADGESPKMRITKGVLYIGEPGVSPEHTDYGGGTVYLMRETEALDKWLVVSDTSCGTEELAMFTSGHHAIPYEFNSRMNVQLVLVGSTNPDLRMELRGNREVNQHE